MSGYKTRYSGGLSTPLSRGGFVCLCVSDYISKKFGDGESYFYLNDLYPDKGVGENETTVRHFFKDAKIVRRSERKEKYKQDAVNLLKSGWAIPFNYTNNTFEEKNAALSVENLLFIWETNKDSGIKIKKSSQSSVVLDELIRGPVQFNLSQEESQISLLGTNGMPLPVLANVADDTDFEIGIVVREWSERQRSCHEAYLHYMRGTCPPYYIHIDFGKDFNIETSEFIRNKLPPQSLVDAVIESMIDSAKEINCSDFRFIRPYLEKFSQQDVRKTLVTTLKDSNKEVRDDIIKAACPLACDQHVKAASDVSRMMAACEMSFEAIMDVCKSICCSKITYNFAHSPDKASPEYGNLGALIMRISSHDANGLLSLENMIMAFSEKAAVHVEKIDRALEFCVIGTIHKGKEKKSWWYEVARILGKEVIVSRIKNAIEFVKGQSQYFGD